MYANAIMRNLYHLHGNCVQLARAGARADSAPQNYLIYIKKEQKIVHQIGASNVEL